MKYRVFITKRETFTSILFLIGLLLLWKGIHTAYQYRHALDLNTMQEYELREGAYVTGNIDTYIGKYVSGKFLGVSQAYLTVVGKSYDFYTIPVGKESYLCIMAHSKALLSQLAAFEEGHGEAVRFEGKMIVPPVDINLAWYKGMDDFPMENLNTSFVIVEEDFGKIKDVIYVGILFLVIAVLRFFSAGGVKNFVTEESEDEKFVLEEKPVRHNDTKQRYYRNYELQAEQMQLSTLEQRLHALKRNALLCIPLLLAGFYIIYRVSLLFGILFIVISVKSIWRYFINSANTMAQSLVKKCSLDSLSMQIEERRKKIEMLEEKG